jgi:hypothetical protein
VPPASSANPAAPRGFRPSGPTPAPDSWRLVVYGHGLGNGHPFVGWPAAAGWGAIDASRDIVEVISSCGVLDVGLPVTVAVCNSANRHKFPPKDRFAYEVSKWAGGRPVWAQGGLGWLYCGIPHKNGWPEPGPFRYNGNGDEVDPGIPEPSFPSSPLQNPKAPPVPALLGM